MKKVIYLFAALIFTANLALAEQIKESVPQMAEPGQAVYRGLLAPPKTDGPLVISANFQVLSINDIDDKDGNFEFVGTLELKWNDMRLSFDPIQVGVPEKIYQGDYQINEIFTAWVPQIVLLNNYGFHEVSGTKLRVQPDGTITLTQMISASAKVDFSLRRLPFDYHRLHADFAVLGFDNTRIVMRANPEHNGLSNQTLSVDQWIYLGTSYSTQDFKLNLGSQNTTSTFVVSIDVKRDSLFMVRLVIVPLAFIALLTLSVFWMSRDGMGDRINICFVGLLTAVAYQIVLGDRMPQISYVTFMNGFINISFFMMAATVVMNLYIGILEKRGEVARADLVEQRARWMFPVTYLGLLLFILSVALVFF